jgi:hypothetical protein
MIIRENLQLKTDKPIYYRLGTYGDRLQDDLNWSADGSVATSFKNGEAEVNISMKPQEPFKIIKDKIVDNKVGKFSAKETFTAFPFSTTEKKDDKVIKQGDIIEVIKNGDNFLTNDGFVVDMSKLKSVDDLSIENKNLKNAISTMKEANSDKILGLSKKNFYMGLFVVVGLIVVSRIIK